MSCNQFFHIFQNYSLSSNTFTLYSICRIFSHPYSILSIIHRSNQSNWVMPSFLNHNPYPSPTRRIPFPTRDVASRDMTWDDMICISTDGYVALFFFSLKEQKKTHNRILYMYDYVDEWINVEMEIFMN